MRPSKRDDLVERALTVFDRIGYHAAGVDRIAAETGVSKTSIYKHFPSKDALIEAVLERRHELFRNWLLARADALRAPGSEGALLAVFDALREWAAGPDFRGCMFLKAAAEFPGPGDPVRARAVAHKAALRDDLAAMAREAGLAAPGALARQLLLLIEGATVTAHLGAGAAAFDDARAAAVLLIGHARAG